ncbi:LamB/YcsF family protein [Olivibacter sp. SDN3]|uniref:LamB/YcsF family protein n=1 Tax=Olivibacter sp. SDN3 TaxID=2764720 RepID=UPI00165173F6|nr:5-oxoprolinase subunit PxpA [Olivibacter sp. SDN3]QNL49414.1 LamB/YcsF family protein [Olivibacter sp. SDN3]
MLSIDLNADIGEAFGNYRIPNDHLLLDYISSANIACGFHAGDPQIMQETVAAAKYKGVAIGAHPGLPDLQGFGRREIKIAASEAYQLIVYQIGALYGFIKASGAKLHHVKPHGALYNMAARDAVLAEAIAQAVYDFDKSLTIYGLAGSEMITAAKKKGLKTAAEVFADRTYQDNGLLTPRTEQNALITDEKKAIDQVILLVKNQQVATINDRLIPIQAETLCLHSDNLNAFLFAQYIVNRLKEEGVSIQAPYT